MGVSAGSGLMFGTIGFAAVGIIVAILLAIYVKQKTKDTTMAKDNAK